MIHYFPVESERPLDVVFFSTAAGNEPVRQWLKSLPKEERHMIGEDILTVQYAWPIGKPLVDSLGGGLWEVRSRLKNRIARVLFIVADGSRSKTSEGVLTIMKHKKNPHRGSRLRDLLAGDGVLEKVEAQALKRAVALQFAKAVKEAALTKKEIAKRMNTSRAAVDRLLDPSNASATLSTLEKAARVLGCRIKIELVPA